MTTTTAQDVLEHRDAMVDVFTEITQDCQLLGLTPIGVHVNQWSAGNLSVDVHFSGQNIAAVDQLAGSYGFTEPGTVGAGNYGLAGRLDIDGRRVQVTVYTGRPTATAVPAADAPHAVEVEDGPDPDVCANPDCDHQRAFHHDGGCMGLSCSCAVFEEPQAVEA